MARKKAPPGALLKRPLKRPYIREWRDDRNLSQETLAARVAELLGTSFTAATLSRIENAKSPYNQRQLEAIAEALRCETWDLLERLPDMEGDIVDLVRRLDERKREQAIEYLRFMLREAG